MIGCWINTVLLAAIGLAVIGFLLVWLRQKKKLKSLDKGE